ncbi:putative ribonuclease H-like domain-containing protein [Tanacetum coccineum]
MDYKALLKDEETEDVEIVIWLELVLDKKLPLIDYQDINGGFVAFRGSPEGDIVLNKLSLNDLRSYLGLHNWYQSLMALDLGSTRMFTPVNAAGSSCDNLGGSILVNAATLTNDDLPTDPLCLGGYFLSSKYCYIKGKHAIGTKWVYRNKKDERGIVVRNKARLVTQGYTQEEGIDYDEVFAPVARIEAIRLFFAYASFMGFIVYQMDVKSVFLYGTIEDEVDVCQPPVKTTSNPIETNKALLKDEEAEDVDVHLYRSMIGSLMYLTASRPDIMFVVCACARFQVTPKVSHLQAVKRIFRYLKGQPKLGLWYPRDSPFDLEAFSDSDYAGASLDKKSTIGSCQFFSKRLISWQYKKQTIVANSTTKAEYVVAANSCGQNPVFHSKTKHIEIRHHFIRDSYEKRLIQVIRIHTDQNVADLLTKAFDVGRFQYLTANYQDINGGFVAFRGSPEGGKITGKGKIRNGKLDFEDVYFVKELKFNLFYVSQMCDKKNSVLFTEIECLVLSPDFKLLDES